MGKAYYYFVASLPLMQFGAKLPQTTEEYLADAKRLLENKDYELLDAILREKYIQTTNSIINAWADFNHSLRNGLAMYRAQKVNKDPMKYVRGEYFEDHRIQQLIQEAERAGDPLEAEKVLSNARWDFLEGLSLGQNYNLEFLIIYGLKLKILERYQVVQSPQGKEIYEQLKKIDFPAEVASTTV